MDQSHYKILEFLARQTIPIKYDKFPQNMTNSRKKYNQSLIHIL